MWPSFLQQHGKRKHSELHFTQLTYPMIRSVECNDTKVYSLASGPVLPHFVSQTKKRKQSTQSKYLELIQDFNFSISSSKIAVSADGNYIAAVGIYPPELKVFDTAELSLKFSRGFDCEVVDFLFLSSDYKKIVLLMVDRTLEFHARAGRHHKLRIPFVGRTLTYLNYTAELLVTGSSSQILRIDLEAGIFQPPIATDCETISACSSSPTLPIVFIGGKPHMIQVYDTREWNCVKTVAIPSECSDTYVSCLDITPNGLFLCVGSSDGMCRIYDIRSASPIAERDHRNGFEILSIKFCVKKALQHNANALFTVLSADQKAVKVWEVEPLQANKKLNETKLIASIDAKVFYDDVKPNSADQCGKINHMTLYPDSGLLFVAQDNPRIGVYFIASLGLAPKWCSFLDLLTEEFEENSKDVVYEEFQFVTKENLQQLGAEHFIGTPFLRPYMHGYFMDGHLYEKLRIASNYEKLEDLRKKRIQERMERKHPMRIQIRRNLRPVNKELSIRLEKRAQTQGKHSEAAKVLLSDNRFAQLFTDPNFAVEKINLGKSLTLHSSNKNSIQFNELK